MKRSPGDGASSAAAAYIRAGRQAIRCRDLDRAGDVLHRALALDDRQPAVHNLLGVLHELRGHRQEAQQQYNEALNLDARYAPARFNLRQSVASHGAGRFMLGNE